MRRPTLHVLLLVAALPLTASAADEKKKDAPAEITWLTSFAEGQKAARKQKKILIVDFFATWCGPCKIMDRQTFDNAGVIKAANESFVCTKVDVDRDRPTAGKYRIAGIPTILFVGPEGEQYARVQFQTAPQFLQTMQHVVDEQKKAAPLAKQLEAEPENAKAAFELAQLFARWHKTDEAAKLLETVDRLDANADPKTDQDLASRRHALPEVYAEIGEGYLENEKPERAEALLRKGLATATRALDIGRLRAALVNSFLARDDKPAAIKELEALIATKDVPGPLKGSARRMLQSMQPLGSNP